MRHSGCTLQCSLPNRSEFTGDRFGLSIGTGVTSVSSVESWRERIRQIQIQENSTKTANPWDIGCTRGWLQSLSATSPHCGTVTHVQILTSLTRDVVVLSDYPRLWQSRPGYPAAKLATPTPYLFSLYTLGSRSIRSTPKAKSYSLLHAMHQNIHIHHGSPFETVQM